MEKTISIFVFSFHEILKYQECKRFNEPVRLIILSFLLIKIELILKSTDF